MAIEGLIFSVIAAAGQAAAGQAEKEEADLNAFNIKTDKEINKKHALHNIARWNWIENNGKGRTYGEIDLADSVYRNNIKSKKYGGNDSSINSHLKYDIKQKMIRAEKIEKEF